MSEWEDNDDFGGDSNGPSSFGGGGGGSGRQSGSRACYKCNEEGHMARDCPTAGDSGGSRSKGCFKCHEEGHMSRDCPNADSGDKKSGCFKCGEEGHFSRECPNADSGDRKSGCFKCGEEGHFSRECPNADPSEKKSGCFKCGEDGHMARDCTNPPKEGELGPDGKPRPPLYVPEHITDENLFAEGVHAGLNFDSYGNTPVSVTGEPEIPPPVETFAASGLRPLLLENIEKSNYSKPTPIQKHCIPTIKAGRDIMGCAQTGSGKTAAFMLPILHKLLEEGIGCNSMSSCAEPAALVVAPTRELAIQIHNEGRKFALHSTLRVVVIYGGASAASQYRQLQSGCSVLVATPGRLGDFIERGRVTLAALKFVVLDEADRMLDMGFIGDIEKLMNNPTMPSREERQTLLFSATFPEEIQTLAGKYLNNYVFYTVGIVGAANTDVVQEILNVQKSDKRQTLLDKIKDITSESSDNKILVFVETKRMADVIAAFLCSQEVNTTSIHGDRFQSQREEALAQFKHGIRNVLVATAVAARGLDIKGVSHVINFDLPKEVDEYVHRIGRTGRVGNRGMAISFYDDSMDGSLSKNLVKILEDAKHEVPQWLKDAAVMGGSSLTYEAGQFASTDMRGDQVSSANFGGPATEEDDW